MRLLRPIRRPRGTGRTQLAAHCLEDRFTPATFNIPNGDTAGLIAAINTCNANNQADTINLAAGGTYTFTDDYNNSGNALPPITPDPANENANPNNTITINGNGATLDRPVTATSFFRFFAVQGFTYSGSVAPALGTLNLNNVGLRGGQTADANGGAILNGINGLGGNVTLKNCTLTGNLADGSGGAVYQTGGTSVIDGCTFSGNIAIFYGGGIGVGAGVSNVINSTISTNRAVSGGGILDRGSMNILHSTIADNRLVKATSGIVSEPGRGGGVYLGSVLSGTGSLRLSHTIIARNSFEATVTNGSGPDVAGSVISLGFNLIGDGTGLTGLTNNVNGDKVGSTAQPIDPKLGPLQNNGGPTQTHALLSDSPAKNSGDQSISNAPTSDQRGVGFPRIQDGRIDIGAFELQSGTAAAARVTGVQTNGGAAQRSMVTSLAVTFSTVVTLPTNAASAFTLTRISDNAVVNVTASAATVGGVTVVTLTGFTGTASANGSLADGRYTLRALAAQITANGQQLDGNGDGVVGDDFVFADSGTATGNQLYRLFGDADGNRVVNAADLNLFRIFLGATTTDFTFDFNRDGVINTADLNEFRIRLGAGVP